MNKIKKFEDFLTEGEKKPLSYDRVITIRSKSNEVFHYDIYLDSDNKVVKIDNQWDVSSIPAWTGMSFDIKSLRHYLSTKRPDFYIENEL